MNDIIETRKKLTDYINKTKRSQSAIAKELGISAGTLSQFLNNNYIGSNNEIADKAEQFLELEQQRSAITLQPKFTKELRNTQLVYSALDYTRAANLILLVVGTAGSGKTTALKHYAGEHNGVVYVQINAVKNSPRSVLNLLVKALGLKNRGTSSDLLDSLIEELTDTRKVIIIDEAQHLTERSFDTLRALNDSAGIGLVYAGTPDILHRMCGQKAMELDQVYSRIGYTCKLYNKYNMEDIQSIFGDFNLNKTIIKHLYNVSSRKGGLRLAISLFKLANDMAKASGETLTVQHLEYAAHNVGSGAEL